jgi:hypothetical protein
MDIFKVAPIIIGVLSLFLSFFQLLIQFFAIKPENLPKLLQPLFIIPLYWYVIIILLCIIIYLTRRKKIPDFPVAAFYRGSLQNVGRIRYQDVDWDVQAPSPRTYESPAEYEKRLPDIIEVNIPPMCPICGVELEEKKGLIYGYVWKCADCGFTKRNKDSYYTEYKRAEKIWKGRCKAGTLIKK